jgi:hypothetical protein
MVASQRNRPQQSGVSGNGSGTRASLPLSEVLVWALAYAIAGVAPEGTDLIYFSFVNSTTLGYGDVTPVERWHLLGPMMAMNGSCCLVGQRQSYLRSYRGR